MLCQTSEICEWFRIICVVNLCSCICCCFFMFFLLFDSTENVIIFKWHFRFCMLLLLLCMLLIGTLLLLLSFKYPLLICIIFVLSGLVYAFCFQLKCNCFFCFFCLLYNFDRQRNSVEKNDGHICTKPKPEEIYITKSSLLSYLYDIPN